MDDQRIGRALKAIRVQRGWRQVDLAQRARVSPSVVGRIEHGQAASIALGKLRRVATTLGARLEAYVSWKGADLPRLIDARHAAMHEAVVGLFAALEGWIIEPEVSFSINGELGIIDVLAWHPGRRILLVGRTEDRGRRDRASARQNGSAETSRCERRSPVRLGSRRSRHLGRDRRWANEPPCCCRAPWRAPTEVPGRWSGDARLVTGPSRPDRRPQFPAKSPRGDASAQCHAHQTRTSRSATHRWSLTAPVRVPKPAKPSARPGLSRGS
jgi:transcriptional regulator with XRE-family HTH domain